MLETFLPGKLCPGTSMPLEHSANQQEMGEPEGNTGISPTWS